MDGHANAFRIFVTGSSVREGRTKTTFLQMNIQIVNKSDHPLPDYESAASAGMDLRALLDSPIVLEPLEREIVKRACLSNSLSG